MKEKQNNKGKKNSKDETQKHLGGFWRRARKNEFVNEITVSSPSVTGGATSKWLITASAQFPPLYHAKGILSIIEKMH